MAKTIFSLCEFSKKPVGLIETANKDVFDLATLVNSHLERINTFTSNAKSFVRIFFPVEK